MTQVVEVIEGTSPVILSMPHTGVYVPEEIAATFHSVGRKLADTDWHIEKLYADVLPAATTVRALFHRYVVDANRSPDDDVLYVEHNTTALCPLTDFEGREIYLTDQQPDQQEIARRVTDFHAPYHRALSEQITRIKALHGVVVLYDCHSIRHQLPFLFDGSLPDFNIGTNDGASCAKEYEAIMSEHFNDVHPYISVVNGRFKGGWTTRHYGNPQQGVHAIQMELTQKNYMDESPPWDYQPELAANIQPNLSKALTALDQYASAISSKGT